MFDVPIPFVVGVPRSGTTLLRLMLDAHPDLAIPPETFFVPAVARLAADPDNGGAQFVDALVSSRVWPDFHLAADDLAAAVARIDPFTMRAGLQCFYLLYAARLGKTRWGDKTPGYNTMMTLIESVVPDVHFIHVVRDGRDVALSHRTANFWWAGDNVGDHARYWRDAIYEARRQATVCRRVIEVRYEDLIRQTTATLTRICEFISLPYHPRMAEFHRFSGERLDEFVDLKRQDGSVVKPREERLALHARTRHPPDERRIGRWRTDLTPDEQRAYAAIAGDLLQELGYEISRVDARAAVAEP
jgi:hypothetical protein